MTLAYTAIVILYNLMVSPNSLKWGVMNKVTIDTLSQLPQVNGDIASDLKRRYTL